MEAPTGLALLQQWQLKPQSEFGDVRMCDLRQRRQAEWDALYSSTHDVLQAPLDLVPGAGVSQELVDQFIALQHNRRRVSPYGSKL